MSQRRRVFVVYDNVAIAAILDEPGANAADSLVLLPSSSRDSEDFDEISRRCSRPAGLRVLRPQPRGMGAAPGRWTG